MDLRSANPGHAVLFFKCFNWRKACCQLRASRSDHGQEIAPLFLFALMLKIQNPQTAQQSCLLRFQLEKSKIAIRY